ncbi:PAS domain S-box protein [Candidatus Saccharibacteria bacterium]|nr:PAS domain S-box protein [Candidatus Saccharibacteria bacterium]
MKNTKNTNESKYSIEHERLTSLINSMADGVIAIDEKRRIVTTNGAALNIIDVNESFAGKAIASTIRLVDKNDNEVDVNNLIDGIKTSYSTRDLRIKYPDGSMVNLYLSIAPVKLGFGVQGAKGHVLLLRDITREKSLEEERDEFISVVSHELRTPIAIAEGNIGNAEFIFEKSGINNEGIKESLKQAHDQVVFLAGMMNDLATLSRAERGKLAVEVEAINVYDLISELSETYKRDADSKGLLIEKDVPTNLEVLMSSRLYVREILQNFVTNAIKYTEKGKIVIGAKNDKYGIRFFVSDTGIGISKADQERVFDKFFRSEDYRTRQNSGTGLGLYVTMKLSRLLHAELDLESSINHGSTFYIFIPNLSENTEK